MHKSYLLFWGNVNNHSDCLNSDAWDLNDYLSELRFLGFE